MNDREIIDLFLERSEDAISRASAEYGERLRRVALGVTGDPGIAEECVNDAYLEAWNRIPPDKPYGYLFAYLGRIVRFSAINRMEREKAQKRSAVLVELTDELADCLPSKADAANEVEAKRLTRSITPSFAPNRSRKGTFSSAGTGSATPWNTSRSCPARASEA